MSTQQPIISKSISFFIYLFLLILPFSSLAQLSGTFTIGSGGDYATFTAAATDLNTNGINGPVTFNVISGTYSEQFELGSISGTSGTNTITFQSQSGNNADVEIQFTANSAGANYIARMNGADYVTIQNMTFTAFGTTYSRIIVINEDSDNININNCILNGIETTSTSTNHSQIFSDQTSQNSDNLNITDNTLNNGSTGIYINGVNTSNLTNGIEISGNTLAGGRRGISVTYVNNLAVTDNTVQADSDRGMEITYGDGAMVIRNNRITVGSGIGIYLNVCDGGVAPDSNPGLVANNTISHTWNSSRGIYLTNSTRQNIYYNSVNSRGGTNSRSFEMSAGSNINVVNNNFANHSGGYAYVVSTPGGIDISDYNNIYSSGKYAAYWGTTNLRTLSDLRSASTKDANSRSVYPHYASATDLSTVAPWLDGAGTSLTDVTDDIDGNVRGGTPDIGAFEFTADASTTTPLSGTLTIGSGGDYANFQSAANDLTLKGISGSVTLSVLSGTYIEQVTFTEVPGASDSDTIFVESATGNASDVTMFYAATGTGDNWVVRQFGADYFHFRNLTLQSNNGTSVSYGRVIYLWGGIDGFGLEDNILTGSPTTSTSENLAIFNAREMMSGSWLFRNNTFNDGGVSIWMQGVNTSILVDDVEITGNTFNNVRQGMYLYYFNDLMISDNTINASGNRGMEITYGDGAMVIRNNRISTGSGNGLYLNACDGGVAPTGSPGLVANNAISHSWNSSRGIYLTNSTHQNIYHNSVNSLGGTNSRSFEMTGGSNINVVNNNFANHSGGYAYVVSTPGGIATSDYNNIYSSGKYAAYWGTTNLRTLSDLRSASTKDANSRSVYPHYASATDLSTVAPWLDGAGTSLTDVTDDIDGNVRGGTPDIGAFEFTADASTTTPLSGTLTIGSGGDYANFQSAANDLTLKGISGSVTLSVLSGTYIEQVTFTEVPGASDSDTIFVESATGNASDVTMFYAATGTGDNWVVRQFGADYFHFRNLTLQSNNGTSVSYGRVIYLWGGIDGFGLEDNILTGSPTTSTSENLAIFNAREMMSGSWLFRNNTFNDGGVSIWMQGVNTSILVDDVEITGNTFNNVRQGMYLYYFNDLMISDNTINASGNRGMEITYGDGAMVIRNNRISTGSGNGLYLNACDGGVAPTGSPGLVANNAISHSWNSSRGIYLTNSTHQNIYHNSVNSLGGTNSRSFEMTGGSNINVVNNNFANHSGGYAYVVSTPGGIATSDYNNIYSSGKYAAYWGTTNLRTLSDLRSASTKDANSRSVYPHYASATDLSTVAPWLDGAGTSLTDVTDDIDGNVRGGTPDIGAFEFTADASTTTPLSGTLTIGSGGDYANFQSAANDLTLKGISGSVTLSVLSGTYIEQVTFTEVPGASDSDTIFVESATGNASDVTMFYAATGTGDNWVVRQFGADYFHFRNLTLQSNNGTSVSYGRVIYLWGGIDGFGLEDNILTGSPTTSTSENLAIFNAREMMSGSWLFRNNTFNDGGVSIWMQGVNTSILVDDVEITGNTFNNVRQGMYLYYFNDLMISDNTINASGNRGMEITYGDGAMVIRNNRISTGSGNGLYLNACDGGVAPTGSPGLVANNAISHSWNSSRGIYLTNSTHQNIYHNSVNSLGGTNSRSFEMTGGSNINVVNNIFSNPSGGYAYVVQTTGALLSSDYNDYYTTGANLAYWGNTNMVDLGALQSANSKDASSFSVNPQFASQTNLHVKSAILDSSATPLADVTDDMDKELRDLSFPDIGADEYLYGFNYAPVIISSPDTIAFADSLYKYQMVAEDQDADTLIYTLITALDFLSIDSTTGLVQGTGDAIHVGDHDVTIEIDDGNGGLAIQNYTLTVEPSLGFDEFGGRVPVEFMISQNYPNPFNPTTSIRFGIPKAANVKLVVYNILGAQVITLVDNFKPAGYHVINFDASHLASGTYFYRIFAGEFHQVRKMVLVR